MTDETAGREAAAGGQTKAAERRTSQPQTTNEGHRPNPAEPSGTRRGQGSIGTTPERGRRPNKPTRAPTAAADPAPNRRPRRHAERGSDNGGPRDPDSPSTRATRQQRQPTRSAGGKGKRQPSHAPAARGHARPASSTPKPGAARSRRGHQDRGEGAPASDKGEAQRGRCAGG